MKKINDFTSENSKDIFPLDRVITGIEDLKVFKWPKFTEGQDIEGFVDKIHKIITSKLGSFPSLVRQIPQEKIKFPIFRAREAIQINNDQLFTEFSFPPISFTTMGRCNFPKHPVFYASNSPLAAILEIFKESEFKERKIYLSSWSIIPSKEVFYFESFLKSGLSNDSIYHIFNDNLKKDVNETFKGLINQDQVLGLIEYLKFLDNQFISDDNYSISATFAYKRLYVKGNFGSDIIFYPSVQSKGGAANMAINPNFVVNNMKLDRVYLVSLNNYDLITNNFSVTFHQFGQVSKNSILWSNDMEDKNFKKALELDFGGQITAVSRS